MTTSGLLRHGLPSVATDSVVLRSRVVTALTLATLALAIWTHARPIGLAVQDQRWGIVAAWAAAGLWLLATALGQRIPHGVRAVSLLVAVAGMGLAALAAGGMSGSAVAWLLALPVVATLLLGLWGGLASLAVDIAGIAAVGWMLTTGRIPSPAQEIAGMAADPANWFGQGVAFFVLGLAVTATLVLILRAAQAGLDEQRELVAQLQEEKRGLEARLAGGTGDVLRQRAQVETAAEIARLAAQTQEASELMARSVELIRERFDFYHASIFLLDGTGMWAELVASTGEAGRQLLARKHRLAVGSASMIGWVTANRQPRVAGDVGKDPFHFKNPLLPATRAEAAVPILMGTRLLGVLDVQSTEPDAFGETDVRALEAIASELAIALDNVRLLRESRASLGPGRERTLATSWSRLVRTAETKEVHLSGAARDGARPSASVSKEAATLGQPVVAEGGHEVAVPVLVRGEVVATIAARKPEAEPSFDDEDIDVLQAVASQAGQALEAARQYAEEQRRLAELEVVNRVSQAASQLLDLEALYRVLHSQIRQVLGETDLIIALFDEEQQRLSFPYLAEGGEVREGHETAIGNDLISHVIRTRQPLLLVEDIESQAAALDLTIPEKGVRSWVGVPMLVGESNLGAIAVQDRGQERRFSDDDAALLSTIASQVATALENARLLDEVRRTARRQRLIHEITRRVRRAADIDTILVTAARELSENLGAARAYARLAERGETPPVADLEEVG